MAQKVRNRDESEQRQRKLRALGTRELARTVPNDPAEAEQINALLRQRDDWDPEKTHRSSEPHAPAPSEAFIARMKELRARKCWSQADLSKRLAEMGCPHLGRSVIAKIETVAKRGRNLSLDDALAITAALGSSPPHTLFPVSSTDRPVFVAITPQHVVPAPMAREWLRGRWPIAEPQDLPADPIEASQLLSQERRFFFTEISEDELIALAQSVVPGQGNPATAHNTWPEHVLGGDAPAPTPARDTTTDREHS